MDVRTIRILKFSPAHDRDLWGAPVPVNWLEAMSAEGEPDWKMRRDFSAALAEWCGNVALVARRSDGQWICFIDEPKDADLEEISKVFAIVSGKKEGFSAADIAFRKMRPDGEFACRLSACILSRELDGARLPESVGYGSPVFHLKGSAGMVSDVIRSGRSAFSIGLSLDAAQDVSGKWAVAPFFSRRNWVSRVFGASPEKIHALVADPQGRFHEMRMRAAKKDETPFLRYLDPWPKFLKELYRIEMPDPEKLAEDPHAFLPGVLIPDNPSNWGISAHGETGIGMHEQEAWTEWLLEEGRGIIEDDSSVCFQCPVRQGRPAERSVPVLPVLILHDPGYRTEVRILGYALCRLGRPFEAVSVAGLTDSLVKGAFPIKAREIRALELPDIPRALVILPGEYSKEGDPKDAIRKGLAKKGMLSQFITPSVLLKAKKGLEANEDSREWKKLGSIVGNAIHDLDRACGIISRMESNAGKWFDSDPGSVYGVRFIRVPFRIDGKLRKWKIPFICRIDPESMEAHVMSPLFGKDWLSYPKAQLLLCEKSGKPLDKPDFPFPECAFGKGIVIYEKGNVGDGIIRAENVIAFSHDKFGYASCRNGEGAHMQLSGVFRDGGSFWWIGKYPAEMTAKEKIGFKPPEERHGDFLDVRLRKKCASILSSVSGEPEIIEKYMRWLYELSANSIQYQGKSLILPLPLHLLKKMEEYAVCEATGNDD